MFGGSNKRTRQLRTTVRGPDTVWTKAAEVFRDRSMLLRLGMCFAAIAVLLVLVQSWKTPFPYRVGQRAPHGIAAKLDFERVDADATSQLRKAAEDRTPLVFTNHPETLDQLPQQLRSALGEIAQSASLEDLQKLSHDVADAFGLIADTADAGDDKKKSISPAAVFAPRNVEERYLKLKQILGDPEMTTTQMKIDDIVDDFTKFIAPLRRVGIIDPVQIQKLSISRERKLRIVQADKSTADMEVLLPQVRLTDQLNDAGELGKLWLSFPSLTDLRTALSHWLVVTAPDTLQ
ncbi:MAG: hypothetical protein JNG89_20320, partial [Planctomycetaceae bacterium]|nr:hypothetical protein [Planctomycetaceae bacterium]